MPYGDGTGPWWAQQEAFKGRSGMRWAGCIRRRAAFQSRPQDELTFLNDEKAALESELKALAERIKVLEKTGD